MQSGLADSSKERSHNEDESVQHASYVKECYAPPPPPPPPRLASIFSFVSPIVCFSCTNSLQRRLTTHDTRHPITVTFCITLITLILVPNGHTLIMARVAVVTGANKGIGFEIVKRLCKEFDGLVYLTARDAANGQKAVAKLEAEGLHPRFHQLDITSQDRSL